MNEEGVKDVLLKASYNVVIDDIKRDIGWEDEEFRDEMVKFLELRVEAMDL
jgi:hypothetical protein